MTAESLLAAVHALFVTPPPSMALTIITALVDLRTEEGGMSTAMMQNIDKSGGGRYYFAVSHSQ